MRDDRVTPVEEPIAGRADDDVPAVQVVVLDRVRDAGRVEPRDAVADVSLGGTEPRSRMRGGGPILGRHEAPDPIVVEQPAQLTRERGGSAVRDAGALHRSDGGCALDGPLERGVLGQDPPPRAQVVVAEAVRARGAEGRPGIVEQQPRPGRHGRRTAARPAPRRAGGTPPATVLRAPCPGPEALNQTGPPAVGIRIAVDHGVTCGCSTGPLTRRSTAASSVSTQARTSACQAGSSQVRRPVGISGPCPRRTGCRTRPG